MEQKEIKEEYEKKRNYLLKQRDNDINTFQSQLEQEYYQNIDKCKKNLKNDSKTNILRNNFLEFKKEPKLNIEKLEKMRSISNELKTQYQCPIDPLDLIELDWNEITNHSKINIETQIKNKITDIKRKQSKPIIDKYKVQLNTLEQQYKSLLEKKQDITFKPIIPKFRG
ncbi:MAG: hypothetical protein WC934_06095 [Acidithiobacillus sp.]|jgi:hypothetical protein|uniref:hypothetical protein n=1 Tax=Acidithiobacillus sp. TaxID=1872118 RepID=UPI00355FB9E7